MSLEQLSCQLFEHRENEVKKTYFYSLHTHTYIYNWPLSLWRQYYSNVVNRKFVPRFVKTVYGFM